VGEGGWGSRGIVFKFLLGGGKDEKEIIDFYCGGYVD
jgi:hypothetical protein